MNLLQIVQEFCDRTGLTQPIAVITSRDDDARQMKGLLNELVADLMNRGFQWSEIRREAVFASVAAPLQALITHICPAGFNSIVPETLFDRTERRPLWGPREGPRWQENIALPTTGPLYSWRVFDGGFYLQPNPPAGHTLAFEYDSTWPIFGPTSTSDATLIFKPRFTSDQDVFLLSDDLLLTGLRWKWKKEKGLACTTEKQDFESMISQKAGNNSQLPALNMGSADNGDLRPGIYVPLGNWPV